MRAMIAIELAPAPTDEVRALVAELEAVLSAEYPPEQRHGLSLDAIFQPEVRFFIARHGGAAVGCGGVALYDGFAEVKRMYVRPAARGTGAADALLARVEHEARRAGLTVLRLETGDRQHAAMRFYERCGFRRRSAFGAYAAMPERAIATSVFFEKPVAATSAADARRELVAATYDDVAAPYAANLAGELAGKPLDRELLDRFATELRGAGPVIEVGCGPGHVARYLHDRGVEVAGIDLSPAMIAHATRLHPGIAFRVGDMLALDVAPGSLAGIVSFYAIVHLAGRELVAAFAELRRALRPGGALLAAFHVGDEIVRPGALWGVPVALDWTFFATADVVAALAAAGFAIDEVVERAPYDGVEHPSRRAYVRARSA
jgi:SAM-dependent methyltransferase